MARDNAILPGAPPHPTVGVLERAPRPGSWTTTENYTLDIPELSRVYRIAKRILDILVSATVLLIVSPLLALTALAIRLTSKGPALFRQQRVGEGGRIFVMYKFRSMYQDADHTLHQIAYAHFVSGNGGNGKVDRESLALAGLTLSEDEEVALVDGAPRHISWLRGQLHRLRPLLKAEDPRITPLGAIIRITSIDELPQLWNVLIGDMSLVGPRPPIPYEVRLYKPKHLQRLRVQPGVTGIWQVQGRNRVPFEQMVDMDIEYIQRRTFWLDLKLLVLTVPALLVPRKAN